MKWFKPMFLTAAMALVTWGVWHTLTHKHPHAGPGSADAGKGREPAKRDGGDSRYDIPRNGAPAPERTLEGHEPQGDPSHDKDSPGNGNSITGAFTPPQGVPKEVVSETLAPRTGAQAPSGPPSQNDAPAIATLAAQRLGDEFDAALKKAKEEKAAGKVVAAYERLSPWHAQIDKLSLARSTELLDQLDKLALEVLFSRKSYLSQPYQAGTETLGMIAKPLGVPPELLAKINGVQRPDQIRGQQLKVVAGPFHAELRRKKSELTLLLGNKRLYACRFRVGIGPEGAQPGTYKVFQKQMFPTYYPDPSDRKITVPGGDPRNELGTRLIVFKSSEGDGAFHGTINPLSVGKECTQGGVRLLPNDIEDLYDMLVEGESEIVVRD